mgnify:CR=1 FL=1
MTRKPGRQTFTLAGRGVLSNFVSGSLAQAEAFEAEEPPQAVGGDTRWLPVSDIYPGKFQPRQFFSEEAIEALATSFREQGFRGAINVRPLKNGTWEIVAGERRWRAAKLAGLTKVRCLVDQYTDEEALEFALIENLQREDLSKIEETEGILKLIEVKVGIPKERAITIIGAEGHPERIARSDVATSEDMKKILAVLSSFGVELQTFRTKNLRTLALPDDLKTAHLERGLSYSVALELLKIKDAAKRKALLEKAIKRKLSFREIRDRVKAATLVNTDEASPATRVVDTSLVKRLTGLAKRLKSGLNLPEKSPKRRQLERLLGELETLFEESVATSLRD